MASGNRAYTDCLLNAVFISEIRQSLRIQPALHRLSSVKPVHFCMFLHDRWYWQRMLGMADLGISFFDVTFPVYQPWKFFICLTPGRYSNAA